MILNDMEQKNLHKDRIANNDINEWVRWWIRIHQHYFMFKKGDLYLCKLVTWLLSRLVDL